MKTERFLSLAAIFAMVLAFFACSSDSPSDSGGGQQQPSSDSGQQDTQVFCKTSSTCSQISLSACMELVNAGAAQIVSNCNAEPPPPSSSSVAPPPPSSSSVAPPPSSSSVVKSSSSKGISGYCDYGPLVTQANGEVTGGCFPMATADDEANCALWGKVVSSCPSSSSITPSSSSATKPSKIIIELTSYSEEAVLDAGGYGDPKITVNVKSYVGDAVAKNVTTKILLDKEDITSWSGSVKDTVEVYPTADKIVIQPIILDKDVLSDDDVSPPAKQISASQIYVGNSFPSNVNLFEGTKTSCRLTMTFIK